MAKDNLLREAIADAKAVRETALANAKLALQEAFTPKLQSMLSSRLRNEMEGDFEEGDLNTPGSDPRTQDINPTIAKEGKDVTANADADPEKGKAGVVGGENGGGQGLETQGGNSKKVVYEADEENPDEIPGEEVPGEEIPGEGGEDITGASQVPADGEAEVGTEDEQDQELESVIRELEAEENPEMDDPTLSGEEVPGEEVPGEDEFAKEAKDVTAIASEDPEAGTAGDVGPNSGSDTATDVTATTGADTVGAGEEFPEEEGELDLESLVKEVEDELGAEDKKEDEEEFAQKFEGLKKENVKLAKSIKEHRTVITFLRSKLNEINLLNAKLLYSNRIFRANNLSESQKVRVIETIDRANDVREVKLLFVSLAEGLKMKKPITESKKASAKGSASSSTGSTKPTTEVLSEGADMAARFKKLAGVKRVRF